MATHELTTNVAAGPVTGTSYVFGAVDGGSDTGPDAIPLSLIHDYIKSATDQIYPTQAQLSSLSDTVATALLQANATWQGQNLPTTGFAAAIDDTGLVTRAQAQQIFNSAALDVLTTRGDLVSHDGIDLVRIALGGSGHLLQSDGSDPVWVSVATAIGIGTAVQAYDATLQSLSGLGTVADRIAYTTALDTWAETALTSFARTLIDDADATTAQATLGLVIGTDVQAYDAELAAIAGLTSAADRLPYFTGSGTASLATFTTYGRTLAALADASAGRTALGVVIGTDVQAFDADLAALAANATDGLWAHTGAGTGAARTLTAPAAGFTITNPAGIAGNPTFVLADDLAALEALSGTDTIYYRSAASTWTAVTVGGLLSFSAGTLNVGDAELTAIAGLTSAADSAPYFTGSGTASLMTVTIFARTLLDDTTQGGMQTTLGLVPGTDVQAFDADLAALAANSTDGLWAHTGPGTGAARTLTAPAAGFTITNPAGIAGNPTFVLANDLAALEALSGTNTIYYRSAADTWTAVTIGGLLSFSAGTLNVGDAELAALAGLTSAADALPYFTGSGTAALTTFTSFGRSLVDDADATSGRSTLGVVIGTNVQAYHARLADIAGLTLAQGDVIYFNGTNLVNLGPGTSGHFLKTQGVGANPLWAAVPGGGDALTSNTLAQFASTSSAQLAGVMTDETGTGALVFATSPGFTTAANPISNDGAALGTTVLQWSDLFLASGGVLNWNNGDATITHSANTLTFGGASTGYIFDALLDLSDAAAGQIKFTATQNASTDANTLDDYEEGTFTPGVTFGGGSTGITYTTQTGYYVKIGRMVYGAANVTLSAKGSSTGIMAITGLPFTAGLMNWTSAIGYASAFTGLTGALTTVTNPGQTTLGVYQSAAATYSGVTDTAATNTTAVRVNFFYMV